MTSSSTLELKEVKSQTEVLFPFAAEQLKLVSFENVEQCEKLLLQLLLLDEQLDNTSFFRLHVSVIISTLSDDMQTKLLKVDWEIDCKHLHNFELHSEQISLSKVYRFSQLVGECL